MIYDEMAKTPDIRTKKWAPLNYRLLTFFGLCAPFKYKE